MRIYKGEHPIVSVEQLNPNDIPIAYVKNDKMFSVIAKETSYASLPDKTTLIVPYQEFQDLSFTPFDDEGNPVLHYDDFTFNGSSYVYHPKGEESSLSRFTTSVRIQHEEVYQTSKTYNIQLGCADDGSISDAIMSVSADAYKRGVSPSNIRINDGSMTEDSLSNAPFSSLDVFVLYDDEEYADAIKEDIEKHNIDVIVVVSTDHPLITKEKSVSSFLQPSIYDFSNLTFEYCFSYEESDGYNEIKLFDGKPPVLLLEKKGVHRVLIVTDEFMHSISEETQNVNLYYECLFYLYRTRYKTISLPEQWICDYAPDYIYTQKNERNLIHPMIDLSILYPTSNAYKIVDVKTMQSINSDSPIVLTQIVDDKLLFFKKISGSIEKPTALTAVTTRHTILSYTKQLFYVEKPFRYRIDQEKKLIHIESFSSSSNRINAYACTLAVPETEAYLVLTMGRYEFVYNQKDLLPGSNIVLVFEQVSEQKRFVYDTRVLGGGLKDNVEDNFNLFDIGNVYGRPYRIGSCTVISLPKRLKKYEVEIKQEVSKHIIGEDELFLIFE